MTDPGTGGVGAFVDDTRIVIDGTRRRRVRGRDQHLGRRRPAGGQPAEPRGWEIGGRLIDFYAGTSTRDTLLLGFGSSSWRPSQERADLLRRALRGLR